MKKLTLVALVVSLMLGLVLAGCGGDGELIPNPDPGSSCLYAYQPKTGVDGKTIFLKGSGSSFKLDGWEHVFYMRLGSELGDHPTVWHLVCSKEPEKTTFMRITFTNGKVFEWYPIMDFSTNGGGNNPGWVIVAPYGWEIDYIDKGNNNDSNSFLMTTSSANVQFNISGYSKGKPNDPDTPPIIPPDEPEFGSLVVYDDLVMEEEYYKEFYQPLYQVNKANASNTLVSFANPTNPEVVLPFGVTGGFLSNGDNGFTYLEIDTEKFESGSIGVALSNKSGGNSINPKYNSSIGYSFDLAIVDDKFVLTFDDNLIKASVTAIVLSTPVFNNVGQINGHTDVTAGGTFTAVDANGEYEITAGEKVYLFIHFAGMTFYDTKNGERIITGWKLVRTEGPFVREYKYDTADVIVELIDEDGNMQFGSLGETFEELVPGFYTVAIIWNGKELASKEVEVVASDVPFVVDFGAILLPAIPGVTGIPDVIKEDWDGVHR